MTDKKLAFVGSGSPKAGEALEVLTKRYPSVPVDEADIVVALGGDGFILHCLHESMGNRSIDQESIVRNHTDRYFLS